MADGPLPPLVALGRDLRRRGLPVGTGRILTFVRGVEAIGLTDRDSLYWTARATLVASRADLDTFDETFETWFRTLRPDGEPELSLQAELPPDPEDLEGGDALAGEGLGISTTVDRDGARRRRPPRATRPPCGWSRRRSRSSGRSRSRT